MATLDEINQRRATGAGNAVAAAGDLFQVSPQERISQQESIMQARALSPEDREQYRRYALEIAKMSGLPPTVNDDVVNRATYGGLQKIEGEWKTRFGEHSQTQRVRQATQGREKPTDWGEIIAREEGAASSMLEVGAVSPEGKKQPVSPLQVRMAAAARLARTYPQQFPVTAALLRQLQVARQQGGDMGAVNHAKAILADPQKRAALSSDPYAQRALVAFVESEPLVAGEAGSGSFWRILDKFVPGQWTKEPVPGQKLPLEF